MSYDALSPMGMVQTEFLAGCWFSESSDLLGPIMGGTLKHSVPPNKYTPPSGFVRPRYWPYLQVWLDIAKAADVGFRYYDPDKQHPGILGTSVRTEVSYEFIYGGSIFLKHPLKRIYEMKGQV